jgi:ADP-heptose:LPS heptosyltransferase
MKRFQGEALPDVPRVAVIANDALGNFVVATPLLKMLRDSRPKITIDFYGGTRTQELQSASDLLDWSYPLHGSAPNAAARAGLGRAAKQGDYHLVVNLEEGDCGMAFAAILSSADTFVVGPCLGPQGRENLEFAKDERGRLAHDRAWVAPDLTVQYPFLETGFIGEIFCRLCYLEGHIPRYHLPIKDVAEPVPEVLIATAASLKEKLWPHRHWENVLSRIKGAGKTIGLLGAAPKAQEAFWKGDGAETKLVKAGLVEDLRGKYTLPEVVGALAKSRVVLTLDNGILHLAAATQTPIVGLFRHGIHRLWAPPVTNISVLTPGPGHPVTDIWPETVWEAVKVAI